MFFNILRDFLIGLVPILGDLLDAYYKANTRNVRLLEDHLRDKYGPPGARNKTRRRMAGLRLLDDDPRYVQALQEADIQPVSRSWNSEHPEDGQYAQAAAPPPPYQAERYPTQQNRLGASPVGRPTQPPPAEQPKQGSDWGRFMRWGDKSRQPDAEMGQAR